MAEVTKKKNNCHNCGSTDHYANKCPNAKEKFYEIVQVPVEASPAEDSESDSMGDAIREESDDDQDPRGNTNRNSVHTVRGRHATRYCK
ncbi:hypothetical protein O181_017007 [Austropuccinia psidii MF-1]|uniref:CCHC-type domain-containing protein n=1 Tax=Austropuccinia psidii MF-1 TaxID=1389203 RepID=A0A9Q3C536_9BASI|nr:hypothetical protein [Austropuccinia psidii MF-1]